MRAYIKEVKIRNYKTYKNTRIRLSDGINTIIGPNGTGKSNSIEALLFGLGERSLKIFRANKFSDIVYKGWEDNKNKKDVEVAVSLNIVDDKGEEHLFKRVYRPYDNIHIYHYNKKRVSRGTYISKLLTLGGGGFHYVYIPQGGILNQANITSKDLKEIIDEALGIAKFEEKKADAISRLEKAEIKLLALNEKQEILKEIINKLLHQMIYLEKKENIIRITKKLKAARYTLELNHLEPQIKHNSELLKNLRSREESLKGRIIKIENEIEKVENKISQLEKELEEREMEKYRNLLNQKTILLSEISTLQGKENASEEKINRLLKEIEDIEKESKRIKTLVKEKTSAIEGILKTNRTLKREAKKLYREKEDLEKEISELDERLKQAFEEKRSLVEERQEKIERKIKEEAEIIALKKMDGIYKERIKNLDEKISGFNKSILELNGRISELEDKYKKVGEEEESKRGEYEKTLEKSQKISEEIKEAEKLLAKVEKYIDLMEKSEKQRFTEYEKNAKYILKVANDMNINGVIGILGEKIRGPKEIIRLLKEASGRKWYSIIVDNKETAQKLFRLSYELKKKIIIKLASTVGVGKEKPHEKSIINVLRYPAKLKVLLSNLFGQLVVISDLDEAYQYLSQGLGVIHKKGEFIITTGSWIYEGKKKKVIVSKDISKLNEIYKSFKAMIKIRREDYYTTLEKIRDSEKDIIELASEKARLEEIIKILRENSRFLNSLLDYYQKKYRKLLKETKKKMDMKKIREIEKGFTSDITKLDNKITGLQEKIENLRGEKGSLEKEVLDIEKRIEVNNSFLEGIKEDIKEIKNKKIKYKEDISEKKASIDKLRKEIKDFKRGKRNAENQLNDIEKSIQEFSVKVKLLREKIDVMKRKRSEFNEKWRMNNGLLSDHREKISSLKYEIERLNELKNEIERKRMELGYLDSVYISNIQDPLLLDKLIEGYSEELEQLDKEEYYPAPTAREEYLHKIEPYKQFSLNKNQLEKERKAILEFIHKIDEEKENAFNEGFNRIKRKFERLFLKVFPESKVYMELEEPENIDSGIVLYVELKGKPRLPIFSLSGGEKSVIIILFLLSVYSISGNVVFLLDEIDAHVDPRNLNYFAKAIVSQKEESQIIFVTLPRDDILAKMADYLITIFFRNGVSRPVVIPKEHISEAVKNG